MQAAVKLETWKITSAVTVMAEARATTAVENCILIDLEVIES